MIDPINIQDKVVVAVVVTEQEDMLAYIIARVMWALLREIIFKI